VLHASYAVRRPAMPVQNESCRWPTPFGSLTREMVEEHNGDYHWQVGGQQPE
jgi:hypothetical protein